MGSWNAESLIEPFAVEEHFVDGFANHQADSGLFTFVAYRKQGGRNVIVARFVMRMADVPEMQSRTRAALAGYTPENLLLERVGRH